MRLTHEGDFESEFDKGDVCQSSSHDEEERVDVLDLWVVDYGHNDEKKMAHPCYHYSIMTSKNIELESPGCSGFAADSNCFKT